MGPVEQVQGFNIHKPGLLYENFNHILGNIPSQASSPPPFLLYQVIFLGAYILQ